MNYYTASWPVSHTDMLIHPHSHLLSIPLNYLHLIGLGVTGGIKVKVIGLYDKNEEMGRGKLELNAKNFILT